VPIETGSWANVLMTQAAGSNFTSLVDLTMPPGPNNLAGSGSIVGTSTIGGVQELSIGLGMWYFQSHFRELARGIVDWATRGVSLGYDRNYFSMHVDDVF